MGLSENRIWICQQLRKPYPWLCCFVLLQIIAWQYVAMCYLFWFFLYSCIFSDFAIMSVLLSVSGCIFWMFRKFQHPWDDITNVRGTMQEDHVFVSNQSNQATPHKKNYETHRISAQSDYTMYCSICSNESWYSNSNLNQSNVSLWMFFPCRGNGRISPNPQTQLSAVRQELVFIGAEIGPENHSSLARIMREMLGKCCTKLQNPKIQGVSTNGGTLNWMAYMEKPSINGWVMGSPISGNLQWSWHVMTKDHVPICVF